MATRSRIAIENEDGTVESIYCHFDGYIENNGKLLLEYYLERSKVEELINLGDISFLAENVAPINNDHSFVNPNSGVVVAYHRDRGEDYRKPQKNYSKADFFMSDVEEYGYLFTKEGEWKVKVSATNSIYQLHKLLKTQENA